MSKNKVAFWEGRLFSSQSEFLKAFLNSFEWLDKAGSPATYFMDNEHVNRLLNRLLISFENFLGKQIFKTV